MNKSRRVEKLFQKSPGANQKHNSLDFPTGVILGPCSQLNVTHKSEGDVSFMDRDTKFLEMKTPAAWHKSKGKRTHKRPSMSSNGGFLEIQTPRMWPNKNQVNVGKSKPNITPFFSP